MVDQEPLNTGEVGKAAMKRKVVREEDLGEGEEKGGKKGTIETEVSTRNERNEEKTTHAMS